MQHAIPYKSWPLPCNNTTSRSIVGQNNLIGLSIGSWRNKDMLNMVSENAVIVFSKKGCCMSHVVRRLLLALGVNPAVFEIDEKDEVGVLNELGMTICEGNREEKGNKTVQFPAVFIGGRLFGGLDEVMTTHISGDLVPVLKDAGALWL